MEQRGELFTAILCYAAGEELPELDAVTDMALSFISSQLDRDREKWESIREKRVEAGKKGGKASVKSKKQNKQMLNLPSKSKQKQANQAVNVNVNVNDNVNKENRENSLFARFWSAYPRKVSKPNAVKVFKKLNVCESLLADMLAALDWQRTSEEWTKDGGKFIPYPSSWLNGRRWEDEITEKPDKPKYNFRN